jgi:transposase
VCQLWAELCGTGPGRLGTRQPRWGSLQRLATSWRYAPAISYARLSALFAQVWGLHISEGALAHLFHGIKARLAHRVAEILTRLRRRRLICSDETRARVNGRNQWAGGFQNAEVCVPVIRPSRGQQVIQEGLGAHRPTG